MKHTSCCGLAFLGLLACSSSTTSASTPTPDSGTDAGQPSPGTVFTRGTDTFAGFPFVPVDGVAYPKAEDGTVGGVHSSMRIAIADRASLCASGFTRASATRLVIDLESAAAAVDAGTYTVSISDGDGAMTAEIELLDATCKASGDGAHYVATSGTLVLSSVTATEVRGQLDVVLGDGGTLSAAIDVPVCTQTPPGDPNDPTFCPP